MFKVLAHPHLFPLTQGLFSPAGFSNTGFQKSYHDDRRFSTFLPPSVLTLARDDEYDRGLIISERANAAFDTTRGLTELDL